MNLSTSVLRPKCLVEKKARLPVRKKQNVLVVSSWSSSSLSETRIVRSSHQARLPALAVLSQTCLLPSFSPLHFNINFSLLHFSSFLYTSPSGSYFIAYQPHSRRIKKNPEKNRGLKRTD